MRIPRMINTALCALLVVPILAPCPAGAVSIGISFSPTGSYDVTSINPAEGTLVKAYVIARDVPVQGIAGWEGSILVNGPVYGPVSFSHPSSPSAINVLDAPRFQVGFTWPLMPDASGNAILQTISFFYLSGTIYLGLAPSIPSSMNPQGDCRWGTAPCYVLNGDIETIRPFAIRSAGVWTDTAYGFGSYDCGTDYGPPRGATCASVFGSLSRNRIVAIVQDKDTGLPLPGAAVGLYDWGLRRQVATTNAIGQCLFSAGDGISHFYAAAASCQGQEAQAVIGFRGRYETVCTLSPSMQPVISGTVKDDFNHLCIGGARVQLWRDSNMVAPIDSALTESDGSYRIANPGVGSYHLVAYKQGPLADVPQARLYRRSVGTSFIIDSNAGIYPSRDLTLSSNVVVLVHGLMSSAAAWNNVACDYPTTLRGHGWAVLDNVTLPGEVGSTHGWAHIKEQADTLSARIVATGMKSVNVVAHSQGGLVTRWFNEQLCSQDQPMVNRLICLATPHHGSPLTKIPGAIYSFAKAAFVEEAPQWLHAAPEWVVGQLRPRMPAWDDLTPNSNFMKELNQGALVDDWSGKCAFSDPRAESKLASMTSYATIRANTPVLNYLHLGALLFTMGCGENDGVVPSESAMLHALTNNVHNYVATVLVHHKSWYAAPGILESPSVMEAVITLLSAAGSAWPEPAPPEESRVKRTDVRVPSLVVSRDFLVPTGAAGVDSLLVDQADSLSIFWSWRAGQVDLTLVSPDGAVVDSAYVATHTGWERGVDVSGMLGFYKWADPVPGTWRLRASSRPGDADQVVTVFAIASRAISLAASVGEPVGGLFGDRLVTAALESPDEQPITGASVRADWQTPSGTAGSTVLADDGVTPDVAADDGVYSASLVVAPEYGHTAVTISADGQSPYAFKRNVSTGFTEEREATIAVSPTGLRLESHNSLAMSPVTLRIAVDNAGMSDASVMLRWALGDSLVIAESRGTIPAGGSVEYSASHLPMEAGTYRYSVAAISVGSCADDDSGDNAATATIMIGAAITGVEDGGEDSDGDGGPATPRQGAIVSASPNPFNPSMRITVTQKARGQVRLDVFDVRGRLVRRLFSGELSAGSSSVIWDGRDDEGRALPTGSYVIHLRGGGLEDAQKVFLLK